MKEVAIIADSIGCIPGDMIEAYGIEVVAPNIYWNGAVYRDWIDITPGQAYDILRKDPGAFSTAPPSPGDLARTYRRAGRTARSLLCITVSARASTLHDVAVAARELVRDDLPGTPVEVLDSGTCTGAEGFVVMAAARAAAEGKGLEGALEAARGVRSRVDLLFVLDTVRHAYRTGRVPKLASRMGSVLGVRPIMGWSHGRARLLEVARTREKGVDRVLELMRRRVGGERVRVAVHHADALREGMDLRDRVRREFDCVELWLSEFSPVMGYSAGRGALGVAFYTEK